MIRRKTLKAYNASRPKEARHAICHAPFSSLNFEQNGNITACCFNRIHVLGNIKTHSIEEAWTGPKSQALRKSIQKRDLSGGCKLCQELIQAGNFDGSRAKHYDQYAHPQTLKHRLDRLMGRIAMPKVFEFEIDNTCNLACSMCSGYFSSTIRQGREQMPPMPKVYDDHFAKKLLPFLPYLTDLKFLGGEPMLIKPYRQIWELVREHSPSIALHITTNATVWNTSLEDLLSQLRVGFNLSIDSAVPETYESIRQGAQWNKVVSNIQKLKKLSDNQSMYLNIAACVMRSNIHELDRLIEFANGLEAKVHFNIVWNPEHESLRFLPAASLKQILNDIQRQRDRLPTTNGLSEHNANQLSQVIQTIEQWIGFQREDYSQANFSETMITSSDLADSIFTIYRDLYQKSIKYNEAQKALRALRIPEQDESFLAAYFQALVLCSQSIYPDRDHAELAEKISGVMQLMQNQQGVGEMIHEMIEGGLLSQIDFLWGSSDQQLEDTLRAKFYFDATSASIAS